MEKQEAMLEIYGAYEKWFAAQPDKNCAAFYAAHTAITNLITDIEYRLLGEPLVKLYNGHVVYPVEPEVHEPFREAYGIAMFLEPPL